MYVIDQKAPLDMPIPGLQHATWAGSDDGLEQMSVWRQTIAPGGATPPHRHDCEEIVLCSSGTGELHIDGQVHPFCAGQTVAVPRNVLHQIFAVGAQPMNLVAVLAATPVDVYLPDGQKLDLPWRS
ncbi:MAG: cupin domain-containing protein [Burkholderiaceae bacterium]|nr:cupin domain-containing protein [Burkholderiaceae bacterium]